MVANAGVITVNTLFDSEHSAPSQWFLFILCTANVEDLDRVYAVNVRGTFLCYKYAAIQMIAQGRGGRIVGACSGAGKKGK